MRLFEFVAASLLVLLANIIASDAAFAATRKHFPKTVYISRTYNYNWQSEIVSKYPNAKNFTWTPLVRTTASKTMVATRPRPAFHYQKPRVIAITVPTPNSCTTGNAIKSASNAAATIASYDSNNQVSFNYRANSAGNSATSRVGSLGVAQSVNGRIVKFVGY